MQLMGLPVHHKALLPLFFQYELLVVRAHQVLQSALRTAVRGHRQQGLQQILGGMQDPNGMISSS
jgi:hypothetical protein